MKGLRKISINSGEEKLKGGKKGNPGIKTYWH